MQTCFSCLFFLKIIWVTGLYLSSNSVYIWLTLWIFILIYLTHLPSPSIISLFPVFPCGGKRSSVPSPPLSPSLISFFHHLSTLFPLLLISFSLISLPPTTTVAVRRRVVLPLFRRRPFRFLKGFSSPIDFLRTPLSLCDILQAPHPSLC